MNQKQRKEFYPTISYNSKERTEQRWVNDANIYGDINPSWQISLKNGKRLNRRWKKCGGLAIVPDQHGSHRSIYNENYDVEWQKALYNRSFQPDGDDNFYNNQYY